MRQVSLLVFLLLFGLPFFAKGEQECNELVKDSVEELKLCRGSKFDYKSKPDSKVLNLDRISDADAKSIFKKEQIVMSTRVSMSLKNTTVKSLIFGVTLKRNIRIEIHENQQLQEIAVSEINLDEENVVANVTIDVRRNKKLTEESLKKLKELNWDPESYIQDAGECDFQNSPISTLKVLDECSYVNGDLIINKNTELTKPDISKFSEIRGCLKITNSPKLTDLWFLDYITKTSCAKGKNEIKNNENLCLNSEKIFYLERDLRNLEISNNNKCKNTCTPQWLLARNDSEPCHTIIGDLDVTGLPADTKPSDLKHFANVEVIKGRLRIHHNKIKEITFFPKLHTVTNNDKTLAAIHVTDNKNMVLFNFSSLTLIDVPGSDIPLMIVENNNNSYFIPDEDIERYSKMGRMRIEPVKEAPRRNQNMTSFNTSRSESDENGASDDSQNDSMTSSEQWKLTLEIIGGVTAAAVVIGALVVIVLFVRKRLARKKFNAKRKKVERHIKVSLKAAATPAAAEPVTCRETLSASASNSNSSTSMDQMGGDDDEDDERAIVQEKRFIEYSTFVDKGKYSRVSEYIKRLMKKGTSKANTEYTRLHRNDSKVIKINGDDVNFAEAQLKPPENMISKRTYVTKISHEMYSLPIDQLEVKEVNFDSFDDSKIDEFITIHMSTSGKINYPVHVVDQIISYCLKDGAYSQSQLVKVDGPCHFVGDIHGSWHDLQAILCLDPEGIQSTLNIHPMLYYKYVFCGDYVDRGYLDIQTFLFLAVLAKRWKNRIVILRGNHEDGMGRSVHKEEEDKKSLLDHLVIDHGLEDGIALLFKFYKLFEHLPLAALVNGRIFACHGGIGEKHLQFRTLEEAYATIPMPLKLKDVRYYELAEDTFWSDPAPYYWSQSNRGCGKFYDEELLDKFREKFGIDTIVRGHEVLGFAVQFNGKCFSLFGCFNTQFSTIGLPKIANDQEAMDSFYARLPNELSIAVLRINADGTLHLMMIRHKFIKRDMAAAK